MLSDKTGIQTRVSVALQSPGLFPSLWLVVTTEAIRMGETMFLDQRLSPQGLSLCSHQTHLVKTAVFLRLNSQALPQTHQAS